MLLDRFAALLVTLVRWVCIVLASALFLIVVVAIIARYGFGQAVSWTEEVPRYLLIWISFLAAAVGVLKRDHVGFDVLFNALPKPVRRALGVALSALIFGFGWIVFRYGITFVQDFGSRPDGDDPLHQLLVLPGDADQRLPDHGVRLQADGRRDRAAGSRRHHRHQRGLSTMILLLLGLAFIILTALGMPISFAVGVSTVFATLLLPGVDNATIVQRMLTAINTFPLLAVIFFVFAGTLMARGGIARRLVMMAEVLVGWLPGQPRADRLRRLDVLRRRHRLGGRRSLLDRRDDDPGDGEGRLFAPLRDRDRAHRRHHGADHPALDRHDRVRACRRQRVDRGAVPRRRHSRRA